MNKLLQFANFCDLFHQCLPDSPLYSSLFTVTWCSKNTKMNIPSLMLPRPLLPTNSYSDIIAQDHWSFVHLVQQRQQRKVSGLYKTNKYLHTDWLKIESSDITNYSKPMTLSSTLIFSSVLLLPCCLCCALIDHVLPATVNPLGRHKDP